MASWAYEFSCAKSLYEMAPVLNQAGPWQWGVKDCAWYPDFLLCRPQGGVQLCIYEVNPPGGPAYRSYAEIDPRTGLRREAIEPVLAKLLATVGAAGLTEIPAKEWPFD
jgi:hypothetical protein